MNTPIEQDLGRALDEHAREVTGGIELSDVRSRARQLRRTTQRRWAAGLAAVAVVAIAVPVSLQLVPADTDSAPPLDRPTPTAAPDKLPDNRPASLDALTTGAGPAWAYLHDGRVHTPSGDAGALPGHADATTFAAYHGGWLVAGDFGLVQYDASGAKVRSSRSGTIVVSGDGMRTVFQDDSGIHLGIASGMGEGEQNYDVGDAGLVGLLADGPVTNGGAGAQVWTGPKQARTLPGLVFATATSEAAGLVGGYVGGESGGVVDPATGKVLWHGNWRPLAFSGDGSLVAAVPASQNGDWSVLAILDSRTATVLSRADLESLGVTMRGMPVWEDDSHVLFVADSRKPIGQEAVLRLGRSSGIERATPVAQGGATTLEPAPYVLAAGRS